MHGKYAQLEVVNTFPPDSGVWILILELSPGCHAF